MWALDAQTLMISKRHAWSQSVLISKYASQRLVPVTLENLLRMAKQDNLISSAQYVHSEIPVRLARRVSAIHRLPYIVAVNPFISKVGDLYKESFFRMIHQERPVDYFSTKEFTSTLSELTTSHTNIIPLLARGFKECQKYFTGNTDEAQAFLDEMIRARIGIRVIAEHFLALQSPQKNWMGVVKTATSPGLLFETICSRIQELCELNYGSAPEFYIVGDGKSLTLAYIPVHMEYIFMELIKNAFRATVEFSMKQNRSTHPPIEISISRGEDNVFIRIRDQGGGIPLGEQSKVWQYSYTTVTTDIETEDFLGVQSRIDLQSSVGGPIAGLGFGLPMSRIYGVRI